MPLTNAEKQRNYRDRQKADRHLDLKRATTAERARAFGLPFCEWARDDSGWEDFRLSCDIAGIEPPSFDDDRGTRSFSGGPEALTDTSRGGPYAGATNSLARAEVMIGALADAAAALAGIVNRYKQREIEARIFEIHHIDISDPVIRAQALSDIIDLMARLAMLGRPIRWPLPRWKV